MKDPSNTYWNNEGKYQEWYNILKQRVPDGGKAKEAHIDLLRCAANLYYDHFNNGGCNWNIRKPEFWHIVYWDEELAPTAKAEGVESYWRFLNGIAETMEQVEKNEYSDRFAKQWLDGLDYKWETLVNIVIRYAWETEHAGELAPVEA